MRRARSGSAQAHTTTATLRHVCAVFLAVLLRPEQPAERECASKQGLRVFESGPRWSRQGRGIFGPKRGCHHRWVGGRGVRGRRRDRVHVSILVGQPTQCVQLTCAPCCSFWWRRRKERMNRYSRVHELRDDDEPWKHYESYSGEHEMHRLSLF